MGNPDENAKAVGLSALLYSSAGQPEWEPRTKARGSETQDTPSGPWPPSTATWRHVSWPVLPGAITGRSCHLRGHSSTRGRAASEINREEPWVRARPVGMWGQDDMENRNCSESPPPHFSFPCDSCALGQGDSNPA